MMSTCLVLVVFSGVFFGGFGGMERKEDWSGSPILC